MPARHGEHGDISILALIGLSLGLLLLVALLTPSASSSTAGTEDEQLTLDLQSTWEGNSEAALMAKWGHPYTVQPCGRDHVLIYHKNRQLIFGSNSSSYLTYTYQQVFDVGYDGKIKNCALSSDQDYDSDWAGVFKDEK